MVYTYDAGGNMTGKLEYVLTLGDTEAMDSFRNPMRYDPVHPDRMRSYCYEKCEYDAMGRPTLYRDNACTWERGMLKSFTKKNMDLEFGYDARGKRLSKTVTRQWEVTDEFGNVVKDELGNPVTEPLSVTTNYTYFGDKLIRQSDGTDTLDFFYDDSGLSMINHNGTDYLVRKNMMGDVTHLYTLDGAFAANYQYDAWGNATRFLCKDHKVGDLNPILYRGYFYDKETSLYYLKTRYYDPETCRFLNADDENILLLTADHANGIMSYTYCANNPIAFTDSTGTSWWTDFWGKLGALFEYGWNQITTNPIVQKTLMIIGAALEIVGGIALIATGVGGALGMGLIAMGTNSLVSGFLNEAGGGSFFAGWAGGKSVDYFLWYQFLGRRLEHFSVR